MSLKLRNMKGLGPKTEQHLNEVGIHSSEALQKLGAVRAYLKLREECSIKPSINFLYALVGALENRHWTSIAREEKGRLLLELEGIDELKKILRKEGINIEL